MHFFSAESEELSRQDVHSIKLKFIMKVSCIYVVLLLVAIEFCIAHTSFAQTPENRMTKISMKNETLATLFTKLRDQTKLSFVFPPKADGYKCVDLPIADRTVKQVLDIALKGTGFGYRFEGNKVLIGEVAAGEKKNDESNESNASISYPPFIITGRVIDSSTQQALTGVNIFVKGTIKGTSSDAQGKFIINVEESDILIFSFIGFKTVEIPINRRSVIDVAMEVEDATLQEVVINAGYYDVKDREKTGSISRVTTTVITNQPVTNPLQAMQGRMPGIYINQFSGTPGSNFQVRIRGTNSIANGNNPLYVVDGIPFISETMSEYNIANNIYGPSGVSPMNSINPNDIESIEILKDADATAIYGSRGANGVILITTKRGVKGAMKVDVSVKSGFSKMTRRLDLLNTQQYLAMRMTAVANDGGTIRDYEHDINGMWDSNRYTDWQTKLLGGCAKMTDLNVSLSAGGNETQFLFSTSYNNQGTILPGDNTAGRFSTHFSVSHLTPDKKFDARLSVSYFVNNSNIPSNDLTALALQLPPNAPALYDGNGNLNWEEDPVSGESTFSNPLAWLVNRYISRTYNLLTNVELKYKIIKGLHVKANIGLNHLSNDERRTNSSDAAAPGTSSPALSDLTIATGTNRSLIVEPQANWETKISEGKLVVLIGGTYQSRISETFNQRFIGFASNSLIKDPNSSAIRQFMGSTYAEYKYAAFYGRFNYSWGGKYILNLTGRRDGSSRFGPGRQFANLGAAGLAWIFSNEKFAKGLISFLSFGKIRGSYGLTGNDQIGDYKYLDSYGSVGQYHGKSTLGPKQLFNPDYGWEVNRKLEGAIELGFLDDRILATTAWYMNRSSNQLIDYKLAITTGFPSVLQNSPAVVQNTGLEIELTSKNIDNNTFKWTSFFNITFPRNKLVAFPNLESSSYANTFVLGKPLTIQKVNHYLGVNPVTGRYQIEDVNQDGNFTPNDYKVALDLGQYYYGGFNNSFCYHGLQIDVLVQFVKQGGFQFSSIGIPGAMGNQPSSILAGRWQSPGDNSQRQYFSRSGEASLSQVWYYDSDALSSEIIFLRLKNISVQYQLPEKILRKVKSRVYLQGQNLLTFSNYRGLDPETDSGKPAAFVTPPLTTIVAGIQLTF